MDLKGIENKGRKKRGKEKEEERVWKRMDLKGIESKGRNKRGKGKGRGKSLKENGS